MSPFTPRALALFRNTLQITALAAIVALAGASLTTTIFAAFGVLPWLDITAGVGNFAIPNAGMALQIGFTVLCVALAFFVPASGRILMLEKAHRNFKISMDDVARAYQMSHSADRSGDFTLSSEFDSVRDRMEYLREHPDLAELEPGLIEVAGQMSHVTRDLALTYSDDKVARAKTFLRQRQEEVQDLRDRIKTATATCDELRRWIQDVKADERLAVKHMSRLEKDLADLLPELGLEVIRIDTDAGHDVEVGAEAAAQTADETAAPATPRETAKAKPEDDANVVPLAGKPGDKSEGKARSEVRSEVRSEASARALKTASKAAAIAAQSASITGEYADSLSGPVIPSASFGAHVVAPKSAT